MRAKSAAAWLARSGLAARTVFYLLLVYLVIRLATVGGGREADAQGALSTVASEPAGLAALAGTAAGFVAFGLARLWGAVRDTTPTPWQRVTTFLQGAFYLTLSWLPLSYALGNSSTGSERQHQQTARGLLHLPLGRELVFVLGLVVVGVCANQVRTVITQDYAESMDVKGAPGWVPWLVRASATVGIPARAMVFLPIGIFFMIAAVQGDPRHADGLDSELAALARTGWGHAVLAAIALGLLVFTTYSALEFRYRAVTSGQ